MARLPSSCVSLLMMSALMATGCATPQGMHRHHPEQLWSLPLRPVGAQVMKPGPKVPQVVVLRRFENLSASPVGAYFSSVDGGESWQIEQGYAAANDLSVPLYTAAYQALREANYGVWQDWHRVPNSPLPPLQALEGQRVWVLETLISDLEVQVFATDQEVYEAARARLLVTLHDPHSDMVRRRRIIVQMRVERRPGHDLLALLGTRIAAQLAITLNGGLSPVEMM